MADDSIILKIGADASGLVAGMNEASDVVATGTVKMSGGLEKVAQSSEVASHGFSEVRQRTLQARGELAAMEGRSEAVGVALEHMAARSALLGPIIQAAFPVFIVIAFAEAIKTAVEAVDKAKDSVAKEGIEWSRAAGGIHAHSAELEIDNLKLEDEIAKLEGRPTHNALQIALKEADAAAQRLFDSLSKDIDAERELLKEKGVGIWESLTTGAEETGVIYNAVKAPLLELEAALENQRAAYRGTDEAARKAADNEVESQRSATAKLITDLERREVAEKAAALKRLEHPTPTGTLYGPDTIHPALEHAEAVKKVNEAYAPQEAVLAGIKASLVDIAVSEKETPENRAAKLREATEAAQKASAETARQTAQAEIDANEKYKVAVVESAQAILKSQVAIGQVSAADAIAQEKDLERQKTQIQVDALAARRELITKFPSPDKPKDTTAIDDYNSQIGSKQVELVGKIATIDAEGAKETKALSMTQIETSQTAAEAEISSTEKVGIARAEATKTEETARLLLMHNTIAAAQEEARINTDAAIEEARVKSEALVATKDTGIAAAEAKKKVPGATPEEVAKADAEIKKIQENFNAEIEVLALKLNADVANIDAQAAKKVADLTMEQLNRQASEAADMANKELETANRIDDLKLSSHRETIARWRTDEENNLSQWFLEQQATLNKALLFAEQTYGKESEQYAQLIRKKEELDKEYALKKAQIEQQSESKFTQALKQESQQLNNALASWITGHETLANAMKQAWSSIATDAVKYILQVTEKLIMQEVVMKAINALMGGGGQDQATAAAAKKMAAAATDVQADAATASADVFAQAIEGIPFPANLIAAPLLAETTHTEVTGIAALETGGQVTATGPYVLHEREGVLTSTQMDLLRSSSGNTSVTSSASANTRNNHIEVHVHGSPGGLTHGDIIKAVKTGIRRGELSR